MKWLMLTLVVLLVLGVSSYFYLNNSATTMTGNAIEHSSTDNSVKTFVVDSSHLRFYIQGVENPPITVNAGDRVRIEFSSSEGFHDWVIDEFNAYTDRVKAGEKSSVEFVADIKGEFEYYCSVGQHRANGMKGKFIVQ